jgi:hypothetical protein
MIHYIIPSRIGIRAQGGTFLEKSRAAVGKMFENKKIHREKLLDGS